MSIFRSMWRFILLLRPFSRQESLLLAAVLDDLPLEYRTLAARLIRQRRAKIVKRATPYSEKITSRRYYFLLDFVDDDSEEDVRKINDALSKRLFERCVKDFSRNAWTRLPALLAPQIVGFDGVKKGVALQLFSGEPVHVLLVGDTGTGKTDILRAVEDVAPLSVFSLGSGTSSAGLTVTARGHDVRPGILSMADKGIALIDELNLMKTDDRAGLYNAMEKGFIAFDKGGNHFRFDARCSVLATANPAGGKFSGRAAYEVRREMPFEAALLSRFHLVYIVRGQTPAQFMKVAQNVLSQKEDAKKQDAEFVKKYIERAKAVDVVFSGDYNELIEYFVREVKKREPQLAIDITPRFVVGLKRLIMASARMEMRDKVEELDVKRAVEATKAAIDSVRFASTAPQNPPGRV